MIGYVARRLAREEDGVAMMVAVVLLMAISTLSLMSLSVAGHADKSTARGKHYSQALHVAESGVELAIARIQGSGGSFSGTLTGSSAEGSYRVTVTKGARNTFQLDATGGVRSTFTGGKWVNRQLGSHRTIRVTLQPPDVFSSALFSYTTLDLKANDSVTGDVWANQNVSLSNGTAVHGSVIAATGYVSIANGASVDAKVSTGGFDPATGTAVDAAGTIGGDVVASVINPPDPITCGGADPSKYKVSVSGSIAGALTTWGTKTGSGLVSGGIRANTCTSAPATLAMPVFSYSAGNYPAATLHEYGTPSTASATAVSSFQSYLAAHLNDMRGTFYINQAAPVTQANRIDLSGMTVTGDLNIITNTPIYSGASGDNTADAVVLLASFYDPPTGTSCDTNKDNSECSVHVKNNFSAAGSTAVLVYAPYGPTAIKNNAVQFGAIYSESIEIKNNQQMTYDPRVDRIVGFGPVTLEVTKWVELAAS